MARRLVLLIVAAGAAVVAVGSTATPTLLTVRPYARVSFAAVNEMSGLVKSRRYGDTYWTHNDSGDQARIFAIREDGAVRGSGIAIARARNIDWEDIAIDGGTLYLADVGNNFNMRRDLGVYAVREPDPSSTVAVPEFTWLPIAYPDQRAFPPTADGLRFDCEAIVVIRGTLFFITKHRTSPSRLGVDANLYRLDTRHRDRANVLTKVDHHASLGGAVTAADVSPDGRTLAVLAVGRRPTIWLFDTTAAGDRFFQSDARRLVLRDLKQAEAMAFRDDDTLIVGNEQRDLYRIPLRRFTRAVS